MVDCACGVAPLPPMHCTNPTEPRTRYVAWLPCRNVRRQPDAWWGDSHGHFPSPRPSPRACAESVGPLRTQQSDSGRQRATVALRARASAPRLASHQSRDKAAKDAPPTRHGTSPQRLGAWVLGWSRRRPGRSLGARWGEAGARRKLRRGGWGRLVRLRARRIVGFCSCWCCLPTRARTHARIVSCCKAVTSWICIKLELARIPLMS